MPTSTPASSTTRAGFIVRCVLFLAVLLVSTVPSAHAQLGFTEFAVTDTSLNSSPMTDFWIASAAPADVDRDGDLDLLVAGYFVVYPTEENPDGAVEERLTLYRNDGPAGTEWSLVPVPVDATGLIFTAADLAWGDYDADGDPDVIVAATGEIALYRNDAGTLVRTPTALPPYFEDNAFTTMDQRSITWADADNDGDLDLLVPSSFAGYEWVPTKLLRNDGAGTDGAWTFTEASTVLPIAGNAVSAWGDMEGDGDLDLLLGNVSPNGDNFLETWRNDGGVLAKADADLAFIRYGTADWGDADNDGDLDVVYGGNMDLPDETGETTVRILFNQGNGTYLPTTITQTFPGPEPWLDFSTVSWADFDSDGDVDLLVSGQWLDPNEIEGRAMVYVNTGGTFTAASEPLPAPIAGNAGGAFTWFDVDGDGDLDYFVAGGYEVPGSGGLIEARTQLFRNDAIATNGAPSPPAALQATVSGSNVVLRWNAAGDDHTPASALTYDLEVFRQAGPGSAAIRVSLEDTRSLPQPGNISVNREWTIQGLAPGHYAFSVRAIDNAFNNGLAAWGDFTVGTTAVTTPPARPGISARGPNPFRSETSFDLTLMQPGPAKVEVFDVHGRRVAVLLDRPLSAGTHPVRFDGRALASGVYVIRTTANGGSWVHRVARLGD